MKCANPACDSIAANEITISMNIHMTEVADELEYTGDTDYGQVSLILGTICEECGVMTYYPNWEREVIAYVEPEPNDVVLTEEA